MLLHANVSAFFAEHLPSHLIICALALALWARSCSLWQRLRCRRYRRRHRRRHPLHGYIKRTSSCVGRWQEPLTRRAEIKNAPPTTLSGAFIFFPVTGHPLCFSFFFPSLFPLCRHRPTNQPTDRTEPNRTKSEQRPRPNRLSVDILLRCFR